MLLEDDHHLLELLHEALAHKPFELLTYWDPRLAKQALRSPKESLPAVIVLDIMMPGIDGYTFLVDLRTDDDTRHIPVIVITAKKGMIDVFRNEPNVFAFLEKPFNISVFVDAVQRAVKVANPDV